MKPLTADELLPLVARLSPKEGLRLLKLVSASTKEAELYHASAPATDEFSPDEDNLGWDADGWEVRVKRGEIRWYTFDRQTNEDRF